MIDLILHFLLLGAVVFLLPKFIPGIRVAGYGTGLLVAVVYGLVNVTLGNVLAFLSLPFMFLTLGLFKLVINTFLLWLTDKLIEGFEIKNIGTTFVAAVPITIADALLAWVF